MSEEKSFIVVWFAVIGCFLIISLFLGALSQNNNFVHSVGYMYSQMREYPLVRASAEVRDSVHLDKTVIVGQRTSLRGNVWLGSHVKIQDDTKIWGDVTIGDYTHVNAFVSISSGFHDKNDLGMNIPVIEPVVIGRCVRIDNGAIIQKGVTIGDKAMVKAGAVVTEDVPENAVVEGNPAKITGWKEDTSDEWCYKGI